MCFSWERAPAIFCVRSPKTTPYNVYFLSLTPGFLSKLYRETEILLLNKQNRELVNKKLEVIHAAFANCEGAHISYMESLDNMEEIQNNIGV